MKPPKIREYLKITNDVIPSQPFIIPIDLIFVPSPPNWFNKEKQKESIRLLLPYISERLTQTKENLEKAPAPKPLLIESSFLKIAAICKPFKPDSRSFMLRDYSRVSCHGEFMTAVVALKEEGNSDLEGILNETLGSKKATQPQISRYFAK
uniref:Uncharacterized protein n=1 Tax=Lepeophtheirus salmonis TaxID=72036 RepID=A0A0K2SZU0_LEPSM